MIGQIFKAYDVRAVYPEQINEAAAWKVGYATGQFLLRQAEAAGNRTVLVSRDMRPHSASLCQALTLGLRAAGADVIDLGMCDTSFIYFAINHLNAIGGIQTTASHNPIQYNGFKISGVHAKPIGAQTGLKDIQAIAQSLDPSKGPDTVPPTGRYEERDLWDAYRAHVLRFLRPLRRRVRVFVDASNGMAGAMVPKVFEGVDNLEIIRLNFEITGSFAHDPNPLVAENMKPTQQGVLTHKADLGACFDGDADRCIFTDEQGQIVGCDHLTALLTESFLRSAPADARTIVYDLRSSKVVEEEIRRHGATPARSRVGHVFMKQVLRDTGGIFGGELSGHFYFRDNFYADSGAIAFAALLSVVGESDKPLSELIAPFRRYPQSGEINFRVQDKAAVLAALKEKFGPRGSVDELDGVTIDCWEACGYWFNVRASNTEPLLRLNAEAKERSQLDALLAELRPMLGEEDHGH